MDRRPLVAALLVACLFPLTGCGPDFDFKAGWDRLFKKETEDDKAPPPPPPLASSLAVQDTVQSVAFLEGMRFTVVRGYGIVVGLVGTGGTDCPDDIRKYLQQEVLRRRVGVPAKELLDTKNTAVVVVTGEISAAAQAGHHFDLVVRALGSQTTSLRGGTLLETDLKLLANTAQGIIEGKAYAGASGPLFLSPFVKDEKESDRQRSGRILGGGMLKEARRIRLTLSTPAYSVASRIRDRLNSRYGASGSVADATSPDVIQLTVPEEYRFREKRFLDLVLHTTLNGNAAFLQRRAKELTEEIAHPQAPYEDISLAWEAIGRTVVPVIRPLYSHSIVATSYYTARAGLRLGDTDAVAVVARHALTQKDPFRLVATDELGAAQRTVAGSDALIKLVADPDNRVRVAAYKGLLFQRNPIIHPGRVGSANFVVDVVECEGSPLVHVAATEEQRIALIGRPCKLRAPVSYHDDEVTIAADAKDKEVRIVRTNLRTKSTSPVLNCTFSLPEFVRFLGADPRPDHDGNVRGLGLDYSAVVRILYDLNKQGALPATFIIERPLVSGELTDKKEGARPESEF